MGSFCAGFEKRKSFPNAIPIGIFFVLKKPVKNVYQKKGRFGGSESRLEVRIWGILGDFGDFGGFWGPENSAFGISGGFRGDFGGFFGKMGVFP